MKHRPAILALMVSFFFLSQLVGLAVVSQYVVVTQVGGKTEVAIASLPLGMERPAIYDSSAAFIPAFIAVIIGTVVLLLLMKFGKVALFRIWYYLVVFICLTIALSAFLSTLPAAIIGIAVATVKVFRPNPIVHNLSEIFIYGGLAAIFVPMFSVVGAILLLLVMSAYDIYAVRGSKHMVSLARFQASSNIFAGLAIPYLPNNERTAQKGRKQVKEHLKGSAKGVVRMGFAPVAVLGGGDMGLPLLFAGAVMKEAGFLKALVIPVFAAVALFLLLYRGEKGKFYPAMPFITAGCLVGYAVVRVLFV